MEGGGDGVQAVGCLGELGGGRGWDGSPAWAPSRPAQAPLGRPGRPLEALGALRGPGAALGASAGARAGLAGAVGGPGVSRGARPPGRSWAPALGLEAELGRRGRRGAPTLARLTGAPLRGAPSAGSGPRLQASSSTARPATCPAPLRGPARHLDPSLEPRNSVLRFVFTPSRALRAGAFSLSHALSTWMRHAHGSQRLGDAGKGGCPSRRCRPPSLAGGRPSTNAGKGGRGRHVVGARAGRGVSHRPGRIVPDCGQAGGGAAPAMRPGGDAGAAAASSAVRQLLLGPSAELHQPESAAQASLDGPFGSAEAGLCVKLGAREVGAEQVCASQVRTAEVCVSQVDPPQVGPP